MRDVRDFEEALSKACNVVNGVTLRGGGLLRGRSITGLWHDTLDNPARLQKHQNRETNSGRRGLTGGNTRPAANTSNPKRYNTVRRMLGFATTSPYVKLSP